MDDEAWMDLTGLESHTDGTWRDEAGEVAVVPTAVGWFVGWIDVAWPMPSTPELLLKGIGHVPRGGDRRDLDRLVSRARARRKAALRTCRYCREQHIPGHITGDVCHGCAVSEEGVVF